MELRARRTKPMPTNSWVRSASEYECEEYRVSVAGSTLCCHKKIVLLNIVWGGLVVMMSWRSLSVQCMPRDGWVIGVLTFQLVLGVTGRQTGMLRLKSIFPKRSSSNPPFGSAGRICKSQIAQKTRTYPHYDFFPLKTAPFFSRSVNSPIRVGARQLRAKALAACLCCW